MEAWLAKYALELLAVMVVSLVSGWVGLNKRQRRQLKECRRENRQLKTAKVRHDRDYILSLEFNLKDRLTIEELVQMVQDLRKRHGEPEGDILLEVLTLVRAKMRARLLSASVHTTSSAELEVFSSDDTDG